MALYATAIGLSEKAEKRYIVKLISFPIKVQCDIQSIRKKAHSVYCKDKDGNYHIKEDFIYQKKV